MFTALIFFCLFSHKWIDKIFINVLTNFFLKCYKYLNYIFFVKYVINELCYVTQVQKSLLCQSSE